VKVWRCREEPLPAEAAGARPGSVVQLHGEGPIIAAGAGALLLLEVQPEGRRIMSGSAYVCGHALRIGQELDLRGLTAETQSGGGKS
jgi:methionyl-tRNA formyltransferase